MKYANSLLELIGNTPLVKLEPHGRHHLVARARQGRVPQPRRLGEGPDRGPDDRRGRGQRRAEARRHDRRADLGQHRRRPRAGRPAARLPLHLRVPRQGQRGQAQRARGLRRRGRRLPDRGRPRAPRQLLQRLGPADPRDRGRLEARPVLQPEQPAARTTSRPAPRSGTQTDGRITHFVTGMGTGGTISGVGRFLKEQNPDVQVVGADPAGSVYSGGTGRPYLVEGVGEDFWPDTYDRGDRRPGDRGLRRRLLRVHPPARPRGGPARRRLLRHGGVRRGPARPGARGDPEGDEP